MFLCDLIPLVGGKGANLGVMARETSEQIRQRNESCVMPQAIRASIQTAYAQFNNGHAPVVVRSSATAKDLADASFAGQ